jgi:hypothetical protein
LGADVAGRVAGVGASLAVPTVFAAVPGLGLARLAARGLGFGLAVRLMVGLAVGSAVGLAVGSAVRLAVGSLPSGTAAGRLSLRRWGRLWGRPPRTPGGRSSLIAHIIAHWLDQGLKARPAGPITLNKERSGSAARLFGVYEKSTVTLKRKALFYVYNLN